MEYKERFIDNVITVLSKDFTAEQLRIIQGALIWQSNYADITPHSDLPSTEVYDVTKILNHYVAVKKISGCTENTLDTYRIHLRKFFEYINLPIQKVTTNVIRSYLAYLGQNCANSYVDDARRIINTFLSFCADEEYISSNPCKKITRIRQEKTMEMPFSDSEIALIKDACTTERETALISFLLSTGVRREELTKIKMTDIDFLDRSVLIHGKGKKDRMVYFSAQCELHMKRYVDSKPCPTEYLFTSAKVPYGKLNKNTLAGIVKNIGSKANVSNVHLHRFRKWFATYMVNHNVPIQDLKEMLGHSKLDTTNNYYVYSNMERIKYNYKHNAS